MHFHSTKTIFILFIFIIFYTNFLFISSASAQSIYLEKFKSKTYCDSIIKVFDENSNKLKVLEMACDTIIKHQTANDNNEKMLFYFLKYLQKNKQKISYKFYLALGVQYQFVDINTVLAADYILKAIRDKDIYTNELNLGKAYYMLGNLFYKINDFEQAKEYLLKINDESVFFIKNFKEKIGLYNTLGMIFLKTEQYEKANTYFKKAMQQATIKKDTIWIGITSGNLGSSYFKQKKYKEAFNLLQYDIETSIKYQEYGNAILSLKEVAEIYAKQNDFQNMKIVADKMLDLLKYLDPKVGQKLPSFYATYNINAIYYETIKDFEKALYYKKIAEQKKTEYQDLVREENVQRLRFKYNHDKDLLGVEELTQQNETQQFVIYLVCISLFFLIVLSAILQQKYIQKRKSNKILAQQTAEIIEKNKQINTQNDELQSLNQTKNKLFSLIAHDLRAPLVSLKGILDLFKNDNLTFDEFKEVFPVLDSNVKNTLELTEDLLYWGKLQLEGVSSTPSKIDLTHFVQEKIAKIFLLAQAKNITTEVHLKHITPYIWADEEMLQTICRNLISNAIKFCNPNGKIILSTYQLPQDKFTRFAVQDTGVGISLENVKKLFSGNIFTTKGTKGEKGTGFGLMFCKDFVELNGGHIWVESEVGKGSIFYFTIPIFETPIFE